MTSNVRVSETSVSLGLTTTPLCEITSTFELVQIIIALGFFSLVIIKFRLLFILSFDSPVLKIFETSLITACGLLFFLFVSVNT